MTEAALVGEKWEEVLNALKRVEDSARRKSYGQKLKTLEKR